MLEGGILLHHGNAEHDNDSSVRFAAQQKSNFTASKCFVTIFVHLNSEWLAVIEAVISAAAFIIEEPKKYMSSQRLRA